MDEVVIRKATCDDAAAITALIPQLGYIVPESDINHRLAGILHRADHAVYVAATPESGIVGWVHLYIDYSLMDAPLVMVGGIVVDTTQRGKGIGRKLMEQAEIWGHTQGCAAVYLKSNVIRREAHAFYESLGYHNVKTQYAYRKEL
ncbi:MAG: GNAT family N-acetyltransferase [Anaerolineae bacterium]|nr:GNAT family N-acetyltransferase [Anaerolineae bacterium]